MPDKETFHVSGVSDAQWLLPAFGNPRSTPKTPLPRHVPTRSQTDRFSGFTLIELLAVMAIISVLLTIAVPLARDASRPRSPSQIAVSIAAEFDRAKTLAAARNTYVWTYLGPDRDDSKQDHLQLQSWESADGTPDRVTSNLRSAGRASRYENIALSAMLPPYADRPEVPERGRAETAIWLRFSPSGEVRVAKLPSAADPKEPVEIPPELSRWTEIGLQGMRGGRIGSASDTAVIQIAGLTGQVRRFTP